MPVSLVNKDDLNGVLFVHDPTVLFMNGNWKDFSMDSRIHRGNTLAKLTIYGMVFLAAYHGQPALLAYAAVIVAIIGAVFSVGGGTPMNGYYAGMPKLTSTSFVHDLTKGPSRKQMNDQWRTNLLTNVRERNFYLGGTTGAQSASEYM